MKNKFLSLLVLVLVSIFTPAYAETIKPLAPVTHAISVGFNKDGDYYTPKGRLLWQVSKSEFPEVVILDELRVQQPVEQLVIVAMYGSKGFAGSKTFPVSMKTNVQYLHCQSLISEY